MVSITEETTQKFLGDWFEENKYGVKFEVKLFNFFVDIVAIKNNQISTIEVKEDFYQFKDGIAQCLKYSKYSNKVFLAFPELLYEDFKNKYNIKELPFGLILVDEKGFVKIIKESNNFNIDKKTKNYVKTQFKKAKRVIKKPIKTEIKFLNTPEMRRLIRKTTVESLWIYVLTVLIEKPYHVYGLKKKLEELFKFSVGLMVLYKVIYLLERHKYIEKTNIRHKSGGPERKYYKLTDKGEKLLLEGRDVLEDIVRRLLGSLN